MLNTVGQVKVDQRLIWDSCRLCLFLKIVDDRAVDIDSDLFFEFFSVGVFIAFEKSYSSNISFTPFIILVDLFFDSFSCGYNANHGFGSSVTMTDHKQICIYTLTQNDKSFLLI